MRKNPHIKKVAEVSSCEAERAVIFSRVSTSTQLKRGASLQNQTQRVRHSVANAGIKMVGLLEVQESGLMSQPRQGLLDAIEVAKHWDAILVAEDVTRLVRSEKGAQWIGSPAEWKLFFEMLDGIKVATVIPYQTPLEELHSHKTKAGMAASCKKAGRPSELTFEQWWKILRERFRGEDDPVGIATIARRLGYSHGKVQRALDLYLPRTNHQWKELQSIERYMDHYWRHLSGNERYRKVWQEMGFTGPTTLRSPLEMRGTEKGKKNRTGRSTR